MIECRPRSIWAKRDVCVLDVRRWILVILICKCDFVQYFVRNLYEKTLGVNQLKFS
jgi:hypothetical protein